MAALQPSHPPEVLRDLCERLRRARFAEVILRASSIGEVHVLERDDVAAAVAGGIFEIDREATNRFGLGGYAATLEPSDQVGTVYYAKHGPRRAFVRK